MCALVMRAGALTQPSAGNSRPALSRRQMAGSALLAPAAAVLWSPALGGAVPSAQAEEPATLPVYFGCGCFWHVQHEFVELERSALKRADLELNSRCGYAGGTRLGSGGKVCYHNARGVADYGKLGHAEAVAMRIPPSALPDFAKLYFSLFVAYNLPGRKVIDRADPQDTGPEYRSVLGLPGGVRSPHFEQIERANNGLMKLVEVRAWPSPPACARYRELCPSCKPSLTPRPRARARTVPAPRRARGTTRTRC
jgi:peptide methionine sulfoxide reductase MsrA